jgi:carbamoyltransferase
MLLRRQNCSAMICSMYILGIHDGHGAGVALLRNGKIICQIREDQIINVKYFIGFPHKSIDFVLKRAKIKPSEINYVVLPRIWGTPFLADSSVNINKSINIFNRLMPILGIFKVLLGKIEFRFPSFRIISWFLYTKIFKFYGTQTVNEIKLMLNRKYQIPLSRIIQYDHHLTHAAYAYYTSPFKRRPAVIITSDGEGDLLSASVSITDCNQIIRISESPATASLGYIFMETTAYLGKVRNREESEVMIQASLKSFNPDNLFKGLIYRDTYNPLIIKSKFDTRLTRLFLDQNARKFKPQKIADDIQIYLEELLIYWVKDAVKQTKITNVCFGGGVGLNTKAMEKISKIKEVKRFYVPNNPGDATLPIGAVYLAYYDLMGKSGPKISG